MPSDAVQRVLDRLDRVKPSGDGWTARCPAHEDDTPSLSVSEGDDGRALLNCHAACLTEEVVAALGVGMADLYPDERRPDRRGFTVDDYAQEKRLPDEFLRSEFGVHTKRETGKPPIVAIPYRDTDGFTIRTRFRTADRFWWGSDGDAVTLYGLDRLAATDPSRTVLLVEGESDVHAAAFHDVLAVGVPGASSWRSSWARHLDGRDIFVWREPDRGGDTLVADVADDLPRARVLAAPDDAKDPADLLRGAGDGFRDRLTELCRAARPIREAVGEREPEGDGADQEDRPRGLPQAIPAAEALDEDPPSFLVEGFILKDETGLITGDGGVYKTSVGLAVAAAVAAGEPLFGRFEVNSSGPVLVVSEEDGAGVLRNRLEAIARGHRWAVDEVLPRVHLLALRGATLDSGEWRDHLADEVERVGAVLAVFDPYSRLTRAAENSTDENKENIAFMSRLNREGVAVALIHHAGKQYENRRKIDRVRGASALNQAARWIYFLERNQLGVAVECLKMSRAELPGRFVVEPEIDTEPGETTVWSEATFKYVTEDQAEEEEADRFILDSLRRYPGTNSTGLKELAKGTGINAVEVSAAIRRLETIGKIDYEDGPRNAKEWHLTDRADPAEKSSATSARYPADPAGTLLSKVDEEASPCPSNDREGRVSRGAGEAQQGAEINVSPDDLDAALGGAG